MAVNRLEVAPTQNPDQVASFLAKLSTLQKLAEDPLANPTVLASFVADGIAPITTEEISGQVE